jgi:hypothetical protein
MLFASSGILPGLNALWLHFGTRCLPLTDFINAHRCFSSRIIDGTHQITVSAIIFQYSVGLILALPFSLRAHTQYLPLFEGAALWRLRISSTEYLVRKSVARSFHHVAKCLLSRPVSVCPLNVLFLLRRSRRMVKLGV